MKDKKDKTPDYPIVELKERGRLLLTDEIITQINYLHGRTGKKEWSGMLLYEVVKGNPSKPKDFVLKAKHIFLMDIGTAAYTEYETDEDIVELYDNVEGAMEMKTGQIHTHHDMSTFFSGTDTDELKENLDKHNYYLSLIVNFGATYTAKVAFLSDVVTASTLNYVDDSGKKKVFKTSQSDKTMVIINMGIYYDNDNTFFFDRYDQVVDKIEAAEKKKEEERKKNSKVVVTYPKGQGVLGFKQDGEVVPFEIEDADPKSLTNMQVEHLTRNILAVTPDMSERRSVYTVLHVIADKTTEEELAFYYDLLAKNIEDVIENFFDQAMTYEEMTYILTEVSASINRFSGYSVLEDLVNGVNDIIVDLLSSYKENSNMVEEGEDELDKEIAEVEGNV
jgi:hypothetical protein